MRNHQLLPSPPAIVCQAGPARNVGAPREQQIRTVILQAYWDVVRQMGPSQVAKILASQGRPEVLERL
jgi:hypothetical protein